MALSNNRTDALSWWESLDWDTQYNWVKRVYPDWKFRIVKSSPSMIEKIYNRYKLNNEPE